MSFQSMEKVLWMKWLHIEGPGIRQTTSMLLESREHESEISKSPLQFSSALVLSGRAESILLFTFE